MRTSASDDSGRESNDAADQQRRDREFNRCWEASDDLVPNRLIRPGREAKIADRGLTEKVGILHRQRTIESQLAAHASERCGVRMSAEFRFRRIAPRRMQHQEHE